MKTFRTIEQLYNEFNAKHIALLKIDVLKFKTHMTGIFCYVDLKLQYAASFILRK